MITTIIIFLYLVGWVTSSAQMHTYGRNKSNVRPFTWAMSSIILGAFWAIYVIIYVATRATDVIDAWGNGKPTP